MWDLPAVILRPAGDHLTLLVEARELYTAGHFYSCVAMCGIVAERLAKDVLRASLMVQRGGTPLPPSETAFDQLERVDASAIIRFLKETDLLSTAAAKAAEDLSHLRNQYAHARGKEPQPDALKAIRLLHVLVEGTVSVFKDFEIQDGSFVPKTEGPSG